MYEGEGRGRENNRKERGNGLIDGLIDAIAHIMSDTIIELIAHLFAVHRRRSA